MRKRTLKLGVVIATAIAAAAPLVATQAAYADYAPANGDIVGVGSDTLQYMLDFMADGDAYSDPGYNGLDNANKLVSIDATADANARLAFGADGLNGLGNGATASGGFGTCAVTTGTVSGSGESSASASTSGSTASSSNSCVLNPTVVLRTGMQPVQRPNGSGAGVKALEGDITDPSPTGEIINFARASSAQTPPAVIGGCGSAASPCLDSIVVATENVVMVAEPGGHAMPLSTAQLTSIYNASTPNCVKWTAVGGSSTDAIIPIIPQVGSGTRSFFLGKIGVTNPGNCTQQGEENDPYAMAETSNPADAIEPMSQGRFNLFAGIEGNGHNTGFGSYFLDPTCAFDANTTACGTGTGSSYVPGFEKPPAAVLTGATSDSSTAFSQSRNLYVYFRDSDITSATPWQPGSTENWLNTLLYDPCPTGDGTPPCKAIVNQEGNTVTYGPGGQPFIDLPAGYQDMLDAGVTPVDPDASGNFKAGGA